jgi:hypothetical protein
MHEMDDAQVDGQRIRSLELTVLTQVREGLSGVTAQLVRMSDKVDSVHERVMAMELAKFDIRIEESFTEVSNDLRRTENMLQEKVSDNKTRIGELEKRVSALAEQLSRLGAFIAVGGTVGGLALGAALTKLFGAN